MRSILLIGVNRFGSLLAKQFSELGHQIMAVDKDEERINNILPLVTDAQIWDSTNEAFFADAWHKRLRRVHSHDRQRFSKLA